VVRVWHSGIHANDSAPRCLHACDADVSDGCGVKCSRWEIETITGPQLDVTCGCVKGDRALDTDEDLVKWVLMLSVPVARIVGPGLGDEALLAKRCFRCCPVLLAHR